MNIGIVCAMPMEARGLTRMQLPFCQPVRVFNHYTIVRSGVGGLNAQRATQALQRQGVDAILSWGCAAGLCPDLKSGAMVLPSAVIDPEGQHIAVDRQLHQSLLKRLCADAGIRTDLAMSYDEPVTSRQQKAALYQRFGAIALDMESAAIALLARSYQLPFAAVRVVLDPADQALPNTALQGLQSDGSFALGKGLRALARQPSDIIDLTRLAINSFRANKALRWAASQVTSEALH
jgi:adenosylhomocysteine nucleosidase